jgi:Icc-related predicted phosphoesterase
MKVKYISDLHLEFAPLDDQPLADVDVLVLAGDITIKNRVDWINEQAERFEHVIYVTGNHEYYKSNISNTDEYLADDLDPRIHFLQNSSVKIEDIWFHGSTLWTDMGTPADEYFISKGMSDFSVIRHGPDYRKFRPLDAKLLHHESMMYLKKNVKEGDVVITHHAPSFKSSPEHFIGTPLNPAFATDLSSFIMDYKPKYWIHGHMHNTSDYRIAGTNVLCNPRGYHPMELNKEFNINKTFEV